MAPEPKRLSVVEGAIAAFWLGLAGFLEREAGHTLTAIFLIIVAIKLMDPATRGAAAHDLMVFSLGNLSKGMGSGAKADKP